MKQLVRIFIYIELHELGAAISNVTETLITDVKNVESGAEPPLNYNIMIF